MKTDENTTNCPAAVPPEDIEIPSEPLTDEEDSPPTAFQVLFGVSLLLALLQMFIPCYFQLDDADGVTLDFLCRLFFKAAMLFFGTLITGGVLSDIVSFCRKMTATANEEQTSPR